MTKTLECFEFMLGSDRYCLLLGGIGQSLRMAESIVCLCAYEKEKMCMSVYVRVRVRVGVRVHVSALFPA